MVAVSAGPGTLLLLSKDRGLLTETTETITLFYSASEKASSLYKYGMTLVSV